MKFSFSELFRSKEKAEDKRLMARLHEYSQGYVSCEQCKGRIPLRGVAPLSLQGCPACGCLYFVPFELGDWLVVRPFGSGGMGHVYLAVSMRDPSVSGCAKILNLNERVQEEMIEALLHEAELTKAMGPHPNIVQVYSAGRLPAGAYMLMEHVRGVTFLDRILGQGKGLHPEECIHYVLDIVGALERVQENGYVHRDLNPSNIVLRDELSGVLIDFGLCCTEEEADADRAKVFGTPLYVPPERCLRQGEDFRGDIYSLGMIFFYALTGKPFFSPTEVSDVIRGVVRSLRTQTGVKMGGLDPDLVKVVDRMIRRERAERYGSYDEIRQDLHRVLEVCMKAKAASPIVEARRAHLRKLAG